MMDEETLLAAIENHTPEDLFVLKHENEGWAPVDDDATDGLELRPTEQYGNLVKAARDLHSQKAAIKLSIKKWEFMAQHPGVHDGGSATCALCGVFMLHYKLMPCEVCPIFIATGSGWCIGTPYRDYQKARYQKNQQDQQEAALAELEFIKSL